MKGSDWDATLERIRRSVGVRDPQMVELAVRVAADLGQLQLRSQLGEDVAKDLAIAQASVLNLSEHARNVLGRELLAAFTFTLTKLALA